MLIRLEPGLELAGNTTAREAAFLRPPPAPCCPSTIQAVPERGSFSNFQMSDKRVLL